MKILYTLIFLLLSTIVIATDINLDKYNYKTFSATKGEEIPLISSNTEKTISFLRITEDKVLININPGNKILLYNIGDTKDFYMDNDKITLTLNKIKNNKAELTIKKMETRENIETVNKKENNFSFYKIITPILIVLIIISLIIFFIRRRNLSRYY